MVEKKRKSNPGPLPKVVYAEASVKSIGGVSMFDEPSVIRSDTVNRFYSESQLTKTAVERLKKEGFDVLFTGETTLTIGAPAETYEKVFNTTINVEDREVFKDLGEKDVAQFLECPDTAMPGLIDTKKSPLADVLEGVALNEPVYYMDAPVKTPEAKELAKKAGMKEAAELAEPLMGVSPTPFPPPVDYWHLDVPADVSLGLDADRAHRMGITGRNVKVAMVDSGWYRHPYFVKRGYRVSPVALGPSTANPSRDEHGHGTGESANIFAVAPDARLTMVKLSFVNSVGAFKLAMALRPDIITCSWGSSIRSGPLSAANQALAAAISLAVRRGITVIFSAGNGHYGFPGQHPDVISAGGAYMRRDGSYEASDYASGFASGVYPGRNCPDVCGLVGMKPGAKYIVLPVEPKDYLDKILSGGSHPLGDETPNDDGWATFSGTSAAAPQLAGVCALVKQACSSLNPAQIKSILKHTARDVTTGSCNTDSGGHPAGPGADLATGAGLADAFRAAFLAKMRCMYRRPPVVRRLGEEIEVLEASETPFEAEAIAYDEAEAWGEDLSPIEEMIKEI